MHLNPREIEDLVLDKNRIIKSASNHHSLYCWLGGRKGPLPEADEIGRLTEQHQGSSVEDVKTS